MVAEVSILDLPPEVLVMIMEQLGSCREVVRLRFVCSRFDYACRHVLRAHFLQLQKETMRHCQMIKAETDEKMIICLKMRPSVKSRYRGQKALQRQSTCLYQTNLLLTLLRFSHACTWGYDQAGVTPLVFGELLDAYRRLLCRLKSVNRDNSRKPAAPSMVGHVQTLTLRVLRDFHQKVERRLLNSKDEICTRQRILLPGTSIIEILESCPYIERSTPIVQHPLEKGKRWDGTIRVQMTYPLDGCWLGIRWTEEGNHQLVDSDILQLCVVIRNLAWMKSSEQLCLARDNLDRMINGEVIATSQGSNQAFNVVEEDNRVYFYGLSTYIYGFESLPQLLIHIDVTCAMELLPKSLLEATPNFPQVKVCPNGKQSPFNISIVMESIDLIKNSHNNITYINRYHGHV